MKNIVVLVSGGGTNLQALIDAEKRGEIRGGKITCVIASKADAYALTRSRGQRYQDPRAGAQGLPRCQKLQQGNA